MFVQVFLTINNQYKYQRSRGLSLWKSVLMYAKFDLEDRLVAFAADVIVFTRSLSKEYAVVRIKEQIARSSMSSALNYGEAQAAESRRDFRHKSSIVLKELKETRVGLKFLARLNSGNHDDRETLLQECKELSAIFATIIKRSTLES